MDHTIVIGCSDGDFDRAQCTHNQDDRKDTNDREIASPLH
jgi:hypothetical protein